MKRKHPTIAGEPVSMGALREFVIRRDDGCILRSSPVHSCRGRTGREPAFDSDWTLEHVTGVHGFSDVRRDDDAHCVALCYATNIEHTNADQRAFIRLRLRELHPACTAG